MTTETAGEMKTSNDNSDSEADGDGGSDATAAGWLRSALA